MQKSNIFKGKISIYCTDSLEVMSQYKRTERHRKTLLSWNGFACCFDDNFVMNTRFGRDLK